MDAVVTENGMNGMDESEGGPSQAPLSSSLVSNDFHDAMGEPVIEELEAELPMVYDGQAPLGELLQRVSQSIYTELTELAETCVLAFYSSGDAGPSSDWVQHVGYQE
jgi:mediator of RNA polymerase II transcription subunit 14